MGGILTVADVEAGQTLPGKTVHIERATLVQYAGASLDRRSEERRVGKECS